jgi:hypothetical protein
VRLVPTNFTTENKTPTIGTEIPNGIAAPERLASKLAGLPAEPHRGACKTHEWHKAGARRLPAIRAVAVARIERITSGLVAKGATEAATAIAYPIRLHFSTRFQQYLSLSHFFLSCSIWLVPRHRGFERLRIGRLQGRQRDRVDEDSDAARAPWFRSIEA